METPHPAVTTRADVAVSPYGSRLAWPREHQPCKCRCHPMDPKQEILPPSVLRLLTSSFDLSEADVLADATRVTSWSGQSDELLVDIEKRHRWPAKTAVRYLRNLLFSLGRTPEDHTGP
jgi:hypothetical protein